MQDPLTIRFRGVWYKKVNGRKRHIVVDTLGLMLICMCTAANTANFVAGQKLVELLNNRNHFPRLKKILGDNTYHGVGMDLDTGVTMEASELKEGQKGLCHRLFDRLLEEPWRGLNR